MTTSYSNLFGSNRREPQAVVVTTNIPGGDYSGNVSQLVSGTSGGSDTNNAIIFGTSGVTSNGKYFQFQFPRPAIIDEITIYQSGAFDEGDFNLDVSNDGSTWTTLTSFTWNQVTQVVSTGNSTTKYSYLRIIGTNASKNFSVFPWIYEFQFKIDGNSLEIGNRTTSITASTTITYATGGPSSTLDGDEDSSGFIPNDSNITGKDITFDFGASPVTMIGMEIVLANNSDSYGSWKMQLWNGSSWVDISGAAFSIGGNTPNNGSIAFAEMHTWTNTTAATKYRLFGVSGTANSGGDGINEFNFMFTGSLAGTWASTEATDTMNFRGYQGQFGKVGDLTTTEAADMFAAQGYPHISSLFLGLETTDTFSAYGTLPTAGHLASTENTDIFHATGIGRGEDGVLITTEGTDVFHATGSTPFVAHFTPTEAPDRMVFLAPGVKVRRRRSFFVT